MLVISVVTGGKGHLPPSILRPLATLDTTEEPRSETLLGNLLPRLRSPDDYGATYVLPPKGINASTDDFVDGPSHLLAVLLAMYALGGDATLPPGSPFQSRLCGWTASTYPSKQGKLKPVDRLHEKLEAVFRHNHLLKEKGCAPISNVLLAEESKPLIAELTGRPVKEMGQEFTLAREHVLGSCRPDSEAPTASITLHFAGSFTESLQLVFGPDLVDKYRRARRRRRVLRSKALWASLMALLAASVYLLWHHAAAGDVKIEGKTCLQAYDRRVRPRSNALSDT
ncbi:hypothetical protein ACFL09_00985 [Planctomycetota bacterium]